MALRFTQLKGRPIEATDGEIGRIDDLYFDDEHWTVRHLVVRTGGWLDARQVLLSPAAVIDEPAADGPLRVRLTRDQVRHAPPADEDKPVSRHYEMALAQYYRYPFYWTGPYLWGATAYPGVPPLDPAGAAAAPVEDEGLRQARDAELEAAQRTHLRSAAEVRGYGAQASDGDSGKVDDFEIDPRSWSLRQIVVDTRNWWPGGEVRVAPDEVEAIDWHGRQMRLRIDRETARNRPPAG